MAINASCRHVLDEVYSPVVEAVAHRGDGEEDIAVGCGDDVAAKEERFRAIVRDECSERAGLEVQLQQTIWTVADQESPVRRRFETQRPAAGFGDFAHRSVLRRDRENAPVEKPGVD